MKKGTVLILLFALLLAMAAGPGQIVASADTSQDGLRFEKNTLYSVEEIYDKVPVTMEAWIRLPQDFADRGGVVFGNYRGPSMCCLNFEISGNGNPRLYFVDANNSKHDFTLNADVRTGDWAHLAIVRDPGNRRVVCYLNGQEVASCDNVPDVDPAVAGYAYVLGSDMRTGGSQYFKGQIRSVAVFADMRTPEEIRNDMTGIVANTDGLMGYYEMSAANTGKVIPDLSGQGKDARYVHTWFTDKEPVTDYAYSMCFVGDTQILSYKYPDALATLYGWICDNIETKKMVHVFGLGDITETSAEKEWAYAKDAIFMLNGKIPYTLVRGNHDGSDRFNSTFFVPEYTVNLEGQYKPDKLDNAWRTFRAGNVDYLNVVLDDRADNNALNWASSVIAAHPNHKVIITTHQYLGADGKLLETGERMWNNLVRKHENIVLVVSGHCYTTDIVMLQSKGDHGNVVTQFMIDPQTIDSNAGATGLISMFYFHEDGNTVSVEYYSTVRKQFFMSSSQLTFRLDGTSEPDPSVSPTEPTQQEQPVTPVDNSMVYAVLGVSVVVILGCIALLIVMKKK